MRIRRINEAVTPTDELIEQLSQYKDLLAIGMFTEAVHQETVRELIVNELTEIANGLETIRTDSDADFGRFYALVKTNLEIKKLSYDSEHSRTIGSINTDLVYKPILDKIKDVSARLNLHRTNWFSRPEMQALVAQHKSHTKTRIK